jgi:hypothetical protein
MYEHVPVHRIVENLQHIYNLYRHPSRSSRDSENEREARTLLLRGLINNLRNERTRPSPRTFMELSRRLPLSTGGAFKLVGYRLEKLRELDLSY